MIDKYFCVFQKGCQPEDAEPVAIFDRMQYLMDFMKHAPGQFREQNQNNEILTVAEWRWMVVKKTMRDDLHSI